MRSMTGYGSAGGVLANKSVAVEIRTVNHRFLDAHVRLPRECLSLETEIQQMIRRAVKRGRIDVTVSLESGQVPDLALNLPLAKSYAGAAARLSEELGIPDRIDLKTLLLLPGVIQNSQTAGSGPAGIPAEVSAAIFEFVGAALSSVDAMRIQEGSTLRAELLRLVEEVQAGIGEVRGLACAAVGDLGERLEQRLAEVLGAGQVDPQRLAQEVAILAEKSDFTEEVTRLESHLEQFRGLVDAEEVGKRMDFLLQEMQRETNTILAKCGSLEISRHGIALKAGIEKLREQAQNIE